MMLRLASHAMATRFELALPGGGGAGLRAIGEAALEEVSIWHSRLSRFEPASLLSHINRSAARRSVALDDETFALFSLCERVWRESGGAFDPTVAALMDRWGVGAGECAAPGAPDTGFDGVRLDPSRRAIAFSRPLALDLGAIAKGFALDRAAEILRAHGVGRAFLHGGTSSAVAIGSAPGRAGWSVRVRGTTGDASVTLRDMALGVSAPRGRRVTMDGDGAGHIMDPRASAPATGARTAAVVCESGAEADAWSTALVVLGGRSASAEARMTTLIDDGARWVATDPLGAASLDDRPTFLHTHEAA